MQFLNIIQNLPIISIRPIALSHTSAFCTFFGNRCTGIAFLDVHLGTQHLRTILI